MCSRLNCRFVHLMESDKVEVCDQRVAVCRDHANGQCKRKQCKYYHIPIVLPPANVMATLFKSQTPQSPSSGVNNNNNNINNNNNNSNDFKLSQMAGTTDPISSSSSTTSSVATSTALATDTSLAYSYPDFATLHSTAISTTNNNNGNFTLGTDGNSNDLNLNCIPAMVTSANANNVCIATTPIFPNINAKNTVSPYGNFSVPNVGNISAAKFPKIATTSN